MIPHQSMDIGLNPLLPMRLLLHRLGLTELDLQRDTATVNIRFLRQMLTDIAYRQPFDASYYLLANPDLEAAKIAGSLTNIHQHFATVGFFENRFPCKPCFDARWYRKHYTDLASVFAPNDEDGLRNHFMTTGLVEGRIGSPETERTIWHDG